MSCEIDALFEDNFLIAVIIPFLETGLKEKLPFPRSSFINLQLSSFSNDLGFIYRSSHQRCSMKKGVLRNFTKFTGKHLCQSFIKVGNISKISAKNFTNFLIFPYSLVIFS